MKSREKAVDESLEILLWPGVHLEVPVQPHRTCLSIKVCWRGCPRRLSYSFHLLARSATSMLAARSSMWKKSALLWSTTDLAKDHDIEVWHWSRIFQQHFCWTFLLIATKEAVGAEAK